MAALLAVEGNQVTLAFSRELHSRLDTYTVSVTNKQTFYL